MSAFIALVVAVDHVAIKKQLIAPSIAVIIVSFVGWFLLRGMQHGKDEPYASEIKSIKRLKEENRSLKSRLETSDKILTDFQEEADSQEEDSKKQRLALLAIASVLIAWEKSHGSVSAEATLLTLKNELNKVREGYYDDLYDRVDSERDGTNGMEEILERLNRISEQLKEREDRDEDDRPGGSRTRYY